MITLLEPAGEDASPCVKSGGKAACRAFPPASLRLSEAWREVGLLRGLRHGLWLIKRALLSSAPGRVLTLGLFLCCFAALAGCGAQRGPKAGPGAGEYAGPAGSIADLRKLPQDLLVYARQGDPGRRLLSPAEQARQDERFNRLFFGPWEAARGSVPASEAFAVFGGLKKPSKPRGWAENLLPWSQENWDKLAANAARESYPSRLDKAITVRPTVLREAPTHRPRFSDPSKAGQGYPFDLFQYSALPVGMPLLVLHESADGAWLYVETGLVAGWVPASDTALTDGAFRSRYKNGSYAVIVRDDVPLRDRAGRYVTTGHLGTMLPVLSTSGSTLTLLVPVRDTQGRAVAVASPVAASDAVLKPIPLTPEAVARLGNVMMGQPYGWGGYLQDRDCSQAMRDLFVPFGLWLPRNSSAQAKAWRFVSFVKASPSGKESVIEEEGVPFATLLWLPGHITLYLGTYKGQPVMFHDMWGIRTEERGREGRHIIGRAVVTSLRPGAELADVRKDNLLLARMRGMSVLRYE